jgi:hypothetical protein
MDTFYENNKKRPRKKLKTIGWREWVSLPDLGIAKIKAKVDTGARTSALHAFALHPFKKDGKDKIRFDIHPIQHNVIEVVTCVADIIDKRWVMDSGGHKEERFVILTSLVIGKRKIPIEITLTERDTMLFRMLLGRNAIRKKFIVNPARSFVREKYK